MAIRELIAAGKIELLEELYAAAQDVADEWEDVMEEPLPLESEERVTRVANLCQAALSQYRATRRYLAEEKPPAQLRAATGLPTYEA